MQGFKLLRLFEGKEARFRALSRVIEGLHVENQVMFLPAESFFEGWGVGTASLGVYATIRVIESEIP